MEDSGGARAMRRRGRACETVDACGEILVVERVTRGARREGRGVGVAVGVGDGLEGFRSWGRRGRAGRRRAPRGGNVDRDGWVHGD